MVYPKRLIEVDLPIKRISAHARREKSIRHGHISTLHIWWARRPLAACRAVLCASMWLDPADPNCPNEFVKSVAQEMLKWSDNEHLQLLSKESIEHFIKVNHDNNALTDNVYLRLLLFDFIADFANWDNSNNAEFIKTSRLLTNIAHQALGGVPGSNPLIIDPFAGGGSIPLEALRMGAEVFASDMNPIPFLINKIQLEYIPKYGSTLVEAFANFGGQIKEQATKCLSELYPSNEQPEIKSYIPQVESIIKRDRKNWEFVKIVNENPVAYIWARTIRCEGPNCGIDIPLYRSGWLANKKKRKIGFTVSLNKLKNELEINIIKGIKESEAKGTIINGKAICPSCGYVTPIVSLRKQLSQKKGGTFDSKLMCVISQLTTVRKFQNLYNEFVEVGKFYRLAIDSDNNWNDYAKSILVKQDVVLNNVKQKISLNEIRRVSLPLYGIDTWDKAFTIRQQAGILLLIDIINKLNYPSEIKVPIISLFACALSKIVQYNSSLCRWKAGGENLVDTFGRQAIPLVWDYAEANIVGPSSGNISDILDWIGKSVEEITKYAKSNTQNVLMADAQDCPLADDSVDFFFTDPPYYDAIPYSHLSDFIYTWTRILLKNHFPEFQSEQVPKDAEIVVDRPHSLSTSKKGIVFYEKELQNALTEGLRVTKPQGIGNIVFASKTTASWEALLGALINSGWIITGSWPLDTEMETKVAAIGQARLMSSIHLVCRPREYEDGTLIQNQIGDWQDVQTELPKRIHEWMPRLADEGVVGADAIFACLGPALEVFSRYSKVVQAGSNRVISLREYLEKVWASVSQEALNMVFSGGEAQSLEEDARLTAMWLWTMSANVTDSINIQEDDEEDDEGNSLNQKISGYILEFDTARKIAQGLGAKLEDLKTMVEIKGDKARLFPVQERVNNLFGLAGIQHQPIKKKKKIQLSLAFEMEESEEETIYQMPELKVEQTGKTVLDRLHQAMLLFSTGRTEGLKRFLSEENVGKDDRFWKLAQALNALYPPGTDERRWVEGVQTFKKGLGF